jgi:hypothetical protein
MFLPLILHEASGAGKVNGGEDGNNKKKKPAYHWMKIRKMFWKTYIIWKMKQTTEAEKE